jgi:dihydropyrimidinase
MRTIIRNGRVVSRGHIQSADVLVEGETIAGIGPFGSASADRVIDASGCFVLPGMLDFHTHVDDRIGRFDLADTYESAGRVALENGITTLATFVTQGPGETLRQAMGRAHAKALGRTRCDVLWHLTPTTFGEADPGDMEALLEAGYRTWKFYTTYKAAGIFSSYGMLEGLFRRLGPKGATFLVHCEDDAVIAAVDPRTLDLTRAHTHTLLRPEAAETTAIARLVELAAGTGAPLHVVHVSTAAGAQALAEARSRADVSFETCPQYLFLDDGWLARPDGHRWLCSPPLRSHPEALRRLVREGAADMLATDHCPFCAQDKDQWDGKDLRTYPNGLPGIGALPHLAWKVWEDDPDRAALSLAAFLSWNPARRAGLHHKGALEPGMDADIVVLDPQGPQRPILSTRAQAHEAFPDFTSRLAFRHVLLRGEPKAENGRLLAGAPSGRPLQPPV